MRGSIISSTIVLSGLISWVGCLQPSRLYSGRYDSPPLAEAPSTSNRGLVVLSGQSMGKGAAQSSKAKDLRIFEDIITQAIGRKGSRTLIVSQAQELYTKQRGKKLDSKVYGFTKLTDLVRSLKRFTVEGSGRGKDQHMIKLSDTKKVSASRTKPKGNKPKDLKKMEREIEGIFRDNSAEDLLLSELPYMYQRKHKATLRPKEYGFNTLTQMIRSFGAFAVDVMEDECTFKVFLLSDNLTGPADVAVDSLNAKADEAVTFIDSLEDIEMVKSHRVFRDQDVQAKEVFAVDVETVEDALSLVQLSTSDTTYVFDAMVLGSQAIFDLLEPLLENENALKLIHDLHSEAAIFHGQGGIQLRGVLDTQLAAEYIMRDNFHPAYNAMLRFFERSKHPHKSSMNRQMNEEHKNPFSIRPLPSYALKYAVLDTKLLRRAKDNIFSHIGDEEITKLLVLASERRALFGRDKSHWRSVCFDKVNESKLSSTELLEVMRPEDVLPAEPLVVHSEVATLAQVLPADLSKSMSQVATSATDVVLDLGETPYVWYGKSRMPLGEESRLVKAEELDKIVERIGEIGSDNRAGIDRQLHRVSVIRNRDNCIVGMTMRVGRCITGGAFLISDLLRSNANILILGIPGTGKTTLIREVSRVLAESENVVIVDTSSEIAGTGDIKHVSVGKARRMFVENLDQQRKVMIECVQNHRPDVLVVDEIGRKSEAEAARTAATRGVRLVATAHGSFRSLVTNPDTNGLLGGVTSVTIGDEYASDRQTRGMQSRHRKTLAERAAKPVFDVVVELAPGGSAKCTVILDTAEAVDRIIEGRQYQIQRREWDGSSDSIMLQFDRV